METDAVNEIVENIEENTTIVQFKNGLVDIATSFGGKLVAAILVFIIGTLIIKGVKKALAKTTKISKLDKTV